MTSFQPSVPSIKQESRATNSDQLEGLEHIHTFQTFQDGRAPSVKAKSETRQLSMKIGPQKGLFLRSIEQAITKTCIFQIRKFHIRIPLSVFWTYYSPQGCLQNPRLHPSQNVYKNNSKPRQFSNNNKKRGEHNRKQGHCDLPITESRICYQLKDISSSPKTENKILADDDRLGGDDSVPASGEG